jgi:hypothetical protein
MSIAKSGLLACALALAALTTAHATEGNFSDGMLITLNSDGKYAMGKATPRGLTEAMKNARQLPGGVSLIMSGGKIYIAEDPQGTLYQMLRDKNMSGN